MNRLPAVLLQPRSVSLAMCGLTLFLGYGVRRTSFLLLLLTYGALFMCYLQACYTAVHDARTEAFYLRTGVLLRVLLLFSVPELSDDFYRFLWDGHLSASGIHPFLLTPEQWMLAEELPQAPFPDLYAHMNSPRYFTVYPTLCQLVFWVAARLSSDNIWDGVVVMKVFLLACEVLSIFLLKKMATAGDGWGIPGYASVGYALHPLLIIEVAGNVHFEGAMIAALLVGLRMIQQGRIGWAGLAWACAIAVKLVPLMFAPIVCAWLGWRKGGWFLFVLILSSLGLLLPLLDTEVMLNMGCSLHLYFQKFQFNASLYYLLRAVGLYKTGYDRGDLIGPLLGIGTSLVVMGMAVWVVLRRVTFKGLLALLMWASVVHLLGSAVVHPWYVTLPLMLGLAAGWRVPIAWSASVVLSYSHYIGGVFQEHFSLIAAEYLLLLAVAGWEMRKRG